MYGVPYRESTVNSLMNWIRNAFRFEGGDNVAPAKVIIYIIATFPAFISRRMNESEHPGRSFKFP